MQFSRGRALALLTVVVAARAAAAADDLPWIEVSRDGQAFVRAGTTTPFVPLGFNYDHDERGRLLEDYWDSEWAKVADDFREMKSLGASVVRVHLQLARFMADRETPNAKSLDQLDRLVKLAADTRLYLNLTGLGCYHKQDVPAWYDALGESERWEVQARLWEAIAARCKGSPAVFCYDLMNEPVVPGGKSQPGDWLGPGFAGSYFVQRISLDQRDRPRPDIARAWIEKLAAAIRRHDRRHLITVGLVDWSLDKPGLTSGFVPSRVAERLDFVCVHVYPERGKTQRALDTLAGFAVGKPVVIEETFPLHVSVDEFDRFIEGSRKHAAGWLGFYWGKTPDECRRSGTIADAMMLGYLEWFQRKAPTLQPPR